MTWRKMSGAGNKFFVSADEKITPEITARARSSGAEGLLILDSHSEHRFDASFYNPDGSFGMMCGNGSRCIVRFALDNGVSAIHNKVDFTLNNVGYDAELFPNGNISITFPKPISESEIRAGELEGVSADVYYVNVNSDHVVIDGPLDAGRDIVHVLRHHPHFERGVNVNMAELVGENTIRLMTFERGVEAVTGACGTGALSTSIAFWRKGLVSDSVTVIPPSERRLGVKIIHDGNLITGLVLTGDAQYDD